MDDGTEIELFSKSAVSNKCLQFANGAPYISPESSEWVKLHDVKLDALDDIIEEANGKPVLCAYQFKSDAQRIMKKYGKDAVNLTAELSRKTESNIDRWNAGEIKLLIGHPASMGYGIDGLQDSGSIVVWFGQNWSLELTEQLNARINRNGQKRPVIIHRILCKDTLDLAVMDALNRKDDDQRGLKDAIGRYRAGREVISFL